MQVIKRTYSLFYSPVWWIIDVLLPPRCIGTGEIVDADGMIAPALWQELNFISPPYCKKCGLPFDFEYEVDNATICGACLQEPPRFDTARSALTYNEASRKLLLKFKYGDQQHAANTFARWLRNALEDIDSIDLIIPTPLHPRRLWQRRFNQSALLAKALGRLTNQTVTGQVLKRRRFTAPQKGLSRKSRQKNVRMAFYVPPKMRERIAGKNILLIDDVLTSGATVNECAKALKSSGAKKVHALTVARVLRDSGEPIENSAFYT